MRLSQIPSIILITHLLLISSNIYSQLETCLRFLRQARNNITIDPTQVKEFLDQAIIDCGDVESQ